MEEKVLRKLFLGFIHIHILHHARQEPIYGLWMIKELHQHGYSISAGTLYPILSGLAKDELLSVEVKVIKGKVRKYYSITAKGKHVLAEASQKCAELFQEINVEL